METSPAIAGVSGRNVVSITEDQPFGQRFRSDVAQSGRYCELDDQSFVGTERLQFLRFEVGLQKAHGGAEVEVLDRQHNLAVGEESGFGENTAVFAVYLFVEEDERAVGQNLAVRVLSGVQPRVVVIRLFVQCREGVDCIAQLRWQTQQGRRRLVYAWLGGDISM